MALDRTECRMFGAVPSANVATVANVLRGMSVHVRSIEVLEVVLTVPLQGGAASTQLRLSRPNIKGKNTAQPSDRWLVRHEGLPLRGQSAAGLAGAVREVTESSCQASNAPEFFTALGAHHEYQMETKGNEYICMHEGYELQVHVITVITTTGPPGEPKKSAQAGKWVMDVRVRVPDGGHVMASQAMASFASKLLPLVTLQPALLPIS